MHKSTFKYWVLPLAVLAMAAAFVLAIPIVGADGPYENCGPGMHQHDERGCHLADHQASKADTPSTSPVTSPVTDRQVTSFEHRIKPVEKCMTLTVGAEMSGHVRAMATLMGAVVAEDYDAGDHNDMTEVRVCYRYEGVVTGSVWAEVR